MPDDSTVKLLVKLGKANVEAQVARVEVEDVDRGADQAIFIMDDPGGTNSDGVQEGMDVRIELGWETEYALAFVGRVREVRSLGDSDGKQRVEVKCMDMSIALMNKPPIEGRQHVGTLDKILGKIAEAAKLKLGDVKVEPMPTFSEKKPLDQRNRTEWQMLQDLAETYRARCFIEVNADPKKDSKESMEHGGEPRLYFVSEQVLLDQKPMGTLLYCRGMGRLLEFEVRQVGGGASPVASAAVTDFDTVKTEVREAQPPGPDPQAAPSASRTDQAIDVMGEARAADHAASMENAADSPVQPADQRATRQVSGLPSDPAFAEQAIEQDRTRKKGNFGRGVAIGTVFLRAKGPVTIEGLASGVVGSWYVRRVNHIVERVEIDKKKRMTFRSKLEATQ